MTDITTARNGFEISTDKARLDLDAIHDFLSKHAYWSLQIPRPIVAAALENALCFGVYKGERQIGLARVITDFATIAYLGDVYILDEFRGKGLSKWLMEVVMGHPQLQGLRRWILLTGDAHELYKKFGWTEIADASKWMELHNPEVYKVTVSS